MNHINDVLSSRIKFARDIIVLVAAAAVVFGWYFSTRANTKAIQELKATKLDQVVYDVQMLNIQEDIRKIEAHLDKIEEYIRTK